MFADFLFQENYFDAKRNELISLLYENNVNEIEKTFQKVRDRLDKQDGLSEVDQKALSQIQQAVRVLSLKTNFSKNIRAIYNDIREKLAAYKRWQIEHVDLVDYDTWKNKLGLSENQFRIMLKTITNFQITTGCSNFCRRCNEWALPGPRKHFTYKAVIQLIREIIEAGNMDFCFYSASDPLDWRDQEKNILDILKWFSGYGIELTYGLLTKVPRGSDKIIEKLLMADIDLAVSITRRNRDRIKRIERRSGKTFSVQHDVEELEIPAHLDEDFKSIKSSITDHYGTEITPEGAFFILPTFTSPLYPTGQCRIPATESTLFFLKKKTGRDALPVEYFKPLSVINCQGHEYTLENLLEPQIENILMDNGSEAITPPGMMNLREYFKTFEPDAVRARQKIFSSRVRKLRRKLRADAKKKEGDRQQQKVFFRQEVRLLWKKYKLDRVVESKKKAFSFFLKNMADYLKKNPIKREIIRYLVKEERECLEKKYKGLLEKIGNLDAMLEQLKTETFELFRLLSFKMLDHPDDHVIQQFIKEYPVLFNASKDLFSAQS